MQTYSFTLQSDDQAAEGVEEDLPDRPAAIGRAKALLEALLDSRPHAKMASASVGEGSFSQSDEVEWLGAWDWSPVQGLTWSAEE